MIKTCTAPMDLGQLGEHDVEIHFYPPINSEPIHIYAVTLYGFTLPKIVWSVEPILTYLQDIASISLGD